MTRTHLIGGGVHPFGRTEGISGREQGVFAVQEALADAGLDWSDIQFAFGGSVGSGKADAVMPLLGLSGIPFINVANGCATGGSALLSAHWAIHSGEFDLGIVVGFDKHPRGAFNADPAAAGLPRWYGETGMMLTTQFFAMKIQRYMAEHGISHESLGRVAEKAFIHGSYTPHSWRKEPIALDSILNAPLVCDPLTKYMFCAPGEGAVALVLASEKRMRALGATGPRLRGAAINSRLEGSFEVFSPSLTLRRDPAPTVLAAKAAFDMADVGPEEIDVAQLQDTDSGAEIIHMAENGFCKDGEQEAWFADKATYIGGRLPINTDGGCIACGEPVAASGLRQIWENLQQLRGRAGARQVEGARLAYSQVYGAPGVSAVAILEGAGG